MTAFAPGCAGLRESLGIPARYGDGGRRGAVRHSGCSQWRLRTDLMSVATTEETNMPLTVSTTPHLLNRPDAFIPSLIQAIRGNVADPALQQFLTDLQISPAALVARYDSLPLARKRKLFGPGFATPAPLGDFRAQLLATIRQRASA